MSRRGPFKTITGKIDPVVIGDHTMIGPVLYYTDPTWMDVFTMMCDCHALTWFHSDIQADRLGRTLICPLTPLEDAAS